tara:strand:+ start:327 stop:800 length:474 start_codon:yes stop_codon:yes gene_type:complete
MILEPVFRGLNLKEYSYLTLIKFFFRWLYAHLIVARFFVEYKSVFLHQIASNVKFNLGDNKYDWGSLYASLLKTNSELDFKVHPPVGIFKLCVTGTSSHKDITKVLQGKEYAVINGSHRIATLQFIHIDDKTKKINVIYGKYKDLSRLEEVGYFDTK